MRHPQTVVEIYRYSPAVKEGKPIFLCRTSLTISTSFIFNAVLTVALSAGRGGGVIPVVGAV